MITQCKRLEPSPYEEIMIDTLLENGNGQQMLLDSIQELSKERYVLRLRLAGHPQDRAAARRMRIINQQLQTLWAEVRQVRAIRRIQMEEALGVDPRLVSTQRG